MLAEDTDAPGTRISGDLRTACVTELVRDRIMTVRTYRHVPFPDLPKYQANYPSRLCIGRHFAWRFR